MFSSPKFFLSLVILISIILIATPALAETHIVPLDFETIQEAVDAAVDGDEIRVLPGTYYGCGEPEVRIWGKNLVIKGDPENPRSTVIDCQGSGYAFHISSPAVTINGLTITGAGSSRTAVSAAGGLLLTNSVITENVTTKAAVELFAYEGSTITNSIFSHNITSNFGTLFVSHIFPSQKVNVTNNKFLNNVTGFMPEPLYPGGFANAIVVWKSNSGPSGSAEILVSGNTINNADSILPSNARTGGISIGGAELYANLENNVISNVYGIGSGAITCSATSCSLSNNTITNCSSDGSGGAVHFSHGDSHYMFNNIVWGNNTGTPVSLWDTTLSLAHNLIEDGLDGVYSLFLFEEVINDWGGNFSADPKFISSTDLRLNSNSPAIDAGLSFYATETDMLENPRFDDLGMANTGLGSPNYTDIGAYERQTSSRPAPAPCDFKSDRCFLSSGDVQQQEAVGNME